MKYCVCEVRYSAHYNDVIMSAIASPITSVSIANSTDFSGADQIKHQSSASLAFVKGIHRWPVNFLHKGPVSGKCFHLITSSWQMWVDRRVIIIRYNAILELRANIRRIECRWLYSEFSKCKCWYRIPHNHQVNMFAYALTPCIARAMNIYDNWNVISIRRFFAIIQSSNELTGGLQN